MPASKNRDDDVSKSLRTLPFAAFAACAALSCAVAGYASFHAARAESRDLRERAAQVALDKASIVSAALADNLALQKGIVARASIAPELSDEEFSALAEAVAGQGRSAVRSIQITRKDVIAKVWPLSGNEKALGVQISKRPDQWPLFLEAVNRKGTHVAGPLNLVQGGSGLIARTPIFSKSGDFVGMSQVVVDPAAIFNAKLEASEPWKVAVRGVDGKGASGALIWGTPEVFSSDPVSREIPLPIGSWQIAVSRRDGWGGAFDSAAFLWTLLAGFLASAGAAAAATAFVRGLENVRLNQANRLLDSALRQGDLDLAARARALETVADAVALADATGRISWANPAFASMTGRSNGENLLNALRDPDGHSPMKQALETGSAWSGELRGFSPAFGPWIAEVALSKIAADESASDASDAACWCLVARDVTELRANEADLRARAGRDPLTGLPNRETLVDRLDLARKEHARDRKGFALLFIDLDGFKPVNDKLGHAVGDEALRMCASRISAACRESDSVARYGGDEFVLLARHVELPDGAEILARKIASAIAEPILVDGQSIRLGASIGVALFPVDGSEQRELLEKADLAMYRAKRDRDGPRWRFYRDPSEPLREPSK